jgi:hypothetical protein
MNPPLTSMIVHFPIEPASLAYFPIEPTMLTGIIFVSTTGVCGDRGVEASGN